MYKWIDEDGKVHYSDQPPPDGREEIERGRARRRRARPRPPRLARTAASAAPKGPKTAAEQEMEFRKRRLEAAEADAKRQQEAQAAEEKKRNCAQATSRADGAARPAAASPRQGPTASTIYLSDDEIATELVEAAQGRRFLVQVSASQLSRVA